MNYLVKIANNSKYAIDEKSVKKKYNEINFVSLKDIESESLKITSKDHIYIYLPVKLLNTINIETLKILKALKNKYVNLSILDDNINEVDNVEYIFSLIALTANDELNDKNNRPKMPNYVFGYDKLPKENTLTINKKESEVVKDIFEKYSSGEYGTHKLANYLNAKGIKTKRNSNWSQVAISRIISNKIYIGFINEQYIEECKIVDDSLFEKANDMLNKRKSTFSNDIRKDEKHIFSSLIKCKNCGSTFRRHVRKYKNQYTRWVCTGRNTNGTQFCSNTSSIDEEEFTQTLKDYFESIFNEKDYITGLLIQEYNKIHGDIDKRISDKQNHLSILLEEKDKLLSLYTENLIDFDDLKNRIDDINNSILTDESDIEGFSIIKSNGEHINQLINDFFKNIEKTITAKHITNELISKIVDKMEVDSNVNVEIYLKIINDLNLSHNII